MYVYVFVCVCVCVCNIEGECEGGVLMCTRACREAWRWVVSGGLISVCVCVCLRLAKRDEAQTAADSRMDPVV